MKNKNFYPSVIMLMLLVFIIGCFGSKTNLTDNTTGPTTVIKGSLYTGTISSSSIKTSSTGIKKMATAVQAEAGDTIVAVAKDTGKVFFSSAKTGTDGSFEIPVESGKSYFLEVIKNSQAVAPLTMGVSDSSNPLTMGVSDSSKPIMAIEVNSTADIGTVVLDESKDSAALATEPTALLDETTEARAKQGEIYVPVGADSAGKGEDDKYSGTYAGTTVDDDDDGIADPFDADNDGNEVIDEIDGEEDKKGSAPQGANSWFFMNLKVDNRLRNTYKTDYTDFNIALGVEVFSQNKNSLGKFDAAKTISSVFVIEGPAWLDKATVNNSFGPGQQSSTKFKDINYEIKYNDQMGRHEVFLGAIKPIVDVNATDVLRIRVNYTDGTYEDILKMINAVFTEIPLLSAYSLDGGITWIDVAIDNNSNPIASSSTKHFYARWTRPKDELGNELKGGRYTWEYINDGGGAGEVEVVNSDTSTLPYVEGHYDMSTLSNMVLGGPQGDEIMMGICLRSFGNDNAANNIFFQYTGP